MTWRTGVKGRREAIKAQGKAHEVTRDFNTGVAYIVGHCCGCRATADKFLRQVSPDRWRCDVCATEGK